MTGLGHTEDQDRMGGVEDEEKKEEEGSWVPDPNWMTP